MRATRAVPLLLATTACAPGPGSADHDESDTSATAACAMEFPGFVDADGDGYGDPARAAEGCPGDAGFAENGDDCDDNDGAAHPSATESCDGIDNDCSGVVDDVDTDGDGHGPLDCGGDDCDDNDDQVRPSAEEVCENGRDDDCDGTANDCGWDSATTLNRADALLVGEAENGGFGEAVAVADFDGDGHVDVAVGADTEDTRNGDEGVVRVYSMPGAGEGVVGSDAAFAEVRGADEGSEAGANLATGDFDGDGWADLVTGARYAPNGGIVEAGAVGVALGPLRDTVELDEAEVVLRGTESYSYFGTRIANLGPGPDGQVGDALLLGGFGDNDGGAAWVVYPGENLGDDRSITSAGDLQMFAGQSDGDRLGSMVAHADFDGDGLLDTVLGADGVSGGAVYLFSRGSLRDENAVQDADVTILGASGDGAGYGNYKGLSSPDLDGDGLDEVAIPAPGHEEYLGAVYVLRGSTLAGVVGNLSVEEADTTIVGSEAPEFFGLGLLDAGQLDADTQPDLVVGSPHLDEFNDGGETYVFYGPLPGGTLRAGDASVTFEGTAFSELAGNAGAVARSGTGIDTLLIAADGYGYATGSRIGGVYVLHGRGM